MNKVLLLTSDISGLYFSSSTVYKRMISLPDPFTILDTPTNAHELVSWVEQQFSDIIPVGSKLIELGSSTKHIGRSCRAFYIVDDSYTYDSEKVPDTLSMDIINMVQEKSPMCKYVFHWLLTRLLGERYWIDLGKALSGGARNEDIITSVINNHYGLVSQN